MELVFSFHFYAVHEDKTQVIKQAFFLLRHLKNLIFCLFWEVGCFYYMLHNQFKLLGYAAMNDSTQLAVCSAN